MSTKESTQAEVSSPLVEGSQAARSDKVIMPDKAHEVARALARAARDQGLRHLSASFELGFEDRRDLRDPNGRGWWGKFTVSWQQGRHGADAGRISLSADFYSACEIDLPQTDAEA